MSQLYGNPKHLIGEEEARAALAAFDRLAIIVTHGADGFRATHAPIAYENGRIVSHISRANPQWKEAPCDVMVILPGPDTYISPAWYETKKRDARAVPTWNYESVQIWGRLTVTEDPARLREIVAALSDRHEAGRPEPWAITDAPEDFIERLLQFIVGFDIEIAQIAGKRKMSQEKPSEDVAGVIAALSASADERDRLVAARMKALGL